MSLLRSSYYGLTWLSSPLVSGYLKWATLKGREDKLRVLERKGIASLPRPNKPLLWIHAVSVGESIMALSIIHAIVRVYSGIGILLTTTTTSSAKVVSNKLPRNVIHQYAPVDTPQAVKKFLDYWQPDLGFWIESDLWPNIVHQTQERGIPTLLLNGRISPKSFTYWQKGRSLISPLLKNLALCAVQSEDQVPLFEALGATTVSVMTNAKFLTTPLTVDGAAYASFKRAVGDRPVWLAASTHAGEEEIVFKAHEQLKKDYPTLLTILVPRHVERAEDIRQAALKKGIPTMLRTETTSLDDAELYIANTLGELGLFYALTPVAMMGATFVPKGGHNPIEAAQLGAFVLHGPHIFKNPQLYQILHSLGLAQETEDLYAAIVPWLKTPKKDYVEPVSFKDYREKGLQSLLHLLKPYLTALRESKR